MNVLLALYINIEVGAVSRILGTEGQFKISSGDFQEATKYLVHISREKLEENQLESMWKAQFVDRKVHKTLQELLDSQDKDFVQLLCKKARKLSHVEVSESLARLDIRLKTVAFATPPAIPSGVPHRIGSGRPRAVEKTTGRPTKTHFEVSLADMIRAGLLRPNQKIHTTYMGKRFEATVNPSGQVEFDGRKFKSPSIAGSAARMKATGKKHATNGWKFWRSINDAGQEVTLSAIRERYSGRS